MPEVKPYEDMSVELMQPPKYPQSALALALAITMKQDLGQDLPTITPKMCKFLLDAEHSSLFEHIHYTFLIGGVSRSFLAQITRQRAAHPTSGSQHYQDYQDYPHVVDGALVDNDFMNDAITHSVDAYKNMIKDGVKPEEARQVLPNSATVNYLWTIDARNLVFFLRQRMCNRNVMEMRIFANIVHSLVKENFPELFVCAGPQCVMDVSFAGENACRQGKMQCKQKQYVRV